MAKAKKQLPKEPEIDKKSAMVACILLMQKLVLSPTVRLSVERLSKMTEPQLERKMDALWSIVREPS